MEAEARVFDHPPDVIPRRLASRTPTGSPSAAGSGRRCPGWRSFALTASAAKDWVAGVRGRAGNDVLPREPLSLRELVLRVRRLVRSPRVDPTPVEAPVVVASGPFALDPESLEDSLNGRTIDLSTLERGLLRVLLERPGRVVKRETLVERVWTDDGGAADRRHGGPTAAGPARGRRRPD